VLLFVDARCRAQPGLLDAHRSLHNTPGVALSCTEVLTRTGPSLAARVAALRQGMTLRNLVDVPGRPGYFTTANLGVSRDAFAMVGGFREMRSGADADICWRIQDRGLGSMAVDRRALMEWEPRSSMRDLASQWKRYGNSTAYLEWVYGDISPSNFDSAMSFRERVWQRLKEARRDSDATIVETLASVFVSAVYSFGYLTATRHSHEFSKPIPYEIDATS
jgi:cellulose synthase/poly-beta-1,6-N-acetylglucosamine synthase-like glycosyltransferase